MAPSAPGLVSMMTGWPSAWLSGVAKMRAPSSAAPPGGNGTTRRTGLSGYWALTEKAANAAIKSSARMGNPPAGILMRSQERPHHGGDGPRRGGELFQDGEVVVTFQRPQLRALAHDGVFLRLALQLGKLGGAVREHDRLFRQEVHHRAVAVRLGLVQAQLFVDIGVADGLEVVDAADGDAGLH